jgi:hypothetical protein
LRVFYGPPDVVEERQLGSFGASRDEGRSTEFRIGDDTYEVHHGSDVTCADHHACEGTLERNGARTPLTPLRQARDGLKFVCRKWWTER